jgi:hypothetical protein
MPQPDALALLAFPGILVVTVLGALALAYRGRVPVAATVLGVAVASVLSVAVALPMASQCQDAQNALQAADALLSPAERNTLRGSGPFCPAIYTFRRDGTRTCLVPDGKGGASVGCG